MSNLSELKPVGSITPFTKFCCTIGNLPSSYMQSFTYEEQLLWLCDYLKNTVIPAVNTNAEAVSELQGLYIELKNYVDHYFDSLDVQEEINNKIDNMISNGTFQEILNSVLNSNYTIMIGDSYAVGETPNVLEENWRGWFYYLKNYMRLSDDKCYQLGERGGGFVHKGLTGKKFLDLLQNANNSIPNKGLIKYIIVGGGYNDIRDGYDNIVTAITNFCNYAKTNYPNAKIIIGAFANTSNSDSYLRSILLSNTIRGYQKGAILNGCQYMRGIDNILKDYSLLSSDGIHPTQDAYITLSGAIYECITGGSCSFSSNLVAFQENLPNNLGNWQNPLLKSQIIDDMVYLFMSFGKFTPNQSIENSTNLIDFGVFNFPHYMPHSDYPIRIETYVSGVANSIAYSNIPAQLIFDSDHHLKLSIRNLRNITEISFLYITTTFPTKFC